MATQTKTSKAFISKSSNFFS